jgi:hypothetical protein
MSLLLFLACSGNKVTLGDSASGDDSGLDDTDSGTEALDDTGTGTHDTATTDTETTAATFIVSDVDAAGAVELAWMWAGKEGFEVGDVFASGTIVDGRAVVELPVPPEDQLSEIPDIPGLYATYALPYAFVDEDADLSQDWDEVIEGVGEAWPLYLEGTLPPEIAALGLSLGWNIVLPDETLGLVVVDIDAIPLEGNLLVENETATIGGTVGVEMTSPRLIVLPGVLFTVWSDTAYTTRLYDDVLASTWEVTVDGPPDDSHIYDISGAGLYASLEVPIAYDDLDGDGSLDGDTETLYAACVSGAPAALMWIAPPTEALAALSLMYYGITPGWYPYRTSDTGDLEFLDETTATTMAFDDTCSFE